MSEEEIRIAVAELCGWKRVKTSKWERDSAGKLFRVPKEWVDAENLPNYTQSLDACATFEAGIDDRQWSNALTNVIRDHPHWTSGAVEARYRTAKATPLQRCEAFLRLHGKWVAS